MTGNLSKDDSIFITNLYNDFHLPVMKVIRLNCFSKNPQDHEDILQDVFLTAIKSISKLKTHPVPSRWLYKTALNLTFNFNRNFSDQPKASEENELDISSAKSFRSDNNSEQAPAFNVNKVSDSLLSALSEEEKKLYTLRYKYNFSYKEIAEVLHISENNVGVRIYRLNHHIRKLIGNNCESRKGVK